MCLSFTFTFTATLLTNTCLDLCLYGKATVLILSCVNGIISSHAPNHFSLSGAGCRPTTAVLAHGRAAAAFPADLYGTLALSLSLSLSRSLSVSLLLALFLYSM